MKMPNADCTNKILKELNIMKQLGKRMETSKDLQHRSSSKTIKPYFLLSIFNKSKLLIKTISIVFYKV
jgi:hypothetical protein